MENPTTKQFVITEDLHATQGQRFINYILDMIIVYVILFALVFAIAFIGAFFDSTAFIDWVTNANTLEGYMIFFSVWIPYYTFFERYTSRTVAKFITKTMVVDEDGSGIDFETALKRTLCRIIPFEQFSFFGGNARGWHDSIPNTYVVQKAAFEEAKHLFYDFEEIGNNQEEV